MQPRATKQRLKEIGSDSIIVYASSKDYDKISALALELREEGYIGTENIISNGEEHAISCYLKI